MRKKRIPSGVEKKTVLVKIKTSSIGSVYVVKKLLNAYLETYDSITIDSDEKRIIIDGSSKDDVERVMKVHSRGLSVGGHGGYRFSYSIDEATVNLEDIIKHQKDEITKLTEDNNRLKNEIGKLQRKFSRLQQILKKPKKKKKQE